MGNKSKIMVGKSVWKKPRGTVVLRRDENIKMDLGKTV
jgi:hypothetical protein